MPSSRWRRAQQGSALALLLLSRTAAAQTSSAAAPDTALTRVLSSHATTFDLVNGRLTGAGADSLARIARAHQFLLVGEAPHGIRETPQFTAALFELARPAGYRHLAIEAGPLTARLLESMARKPDPRAEVTAFLNRHTPFTLPFFNWREEADMVARVVGASPSKTDVLWGLDQEFILSPTQHFERLLELAQTPRARAIASRYARASAAGDRQMISERNPAALWMVSAPDDSLARLTEAFVSPKGAEADSILHELAESRAIYHLYFNQKGYESNLRRTDLMKRHFMSGYEAARAHGEAHPRAVIKLGDNHVIRGPSSTHTFEIGSFVPELAIANGGRSFSMLVLVAEGTANVYRPFGSAPADTAQRYDPTSPDAEESFADVNAILPAADPNHWTLIDLRPLRAALEEPELRGAGEKLRRTVLSFDAIVIISLGHASRLLIAP